MRFFEERFLLTDVKSDIALRILFLTMSNADVDFKARNLQWRFYIIIEILSTTQKVELIGRKEFSVADLNSDYKAFIVQIAALNIRSKKKVYLL